MLDYFAFIKNYFKKCGIARAYPSFMKEIDSYEAYFSSHALYSKISIYDRIMYQAEIHWNDSVLFSLEWDIGAIIAYLNRNSLPVIKFPVQCEQLYCDETNVYQNKVNEYAKSHGSRQWPPILLVWVEFVQMYYIIDGNHRYVAASQNNRETIDAIILPAGVHMKYMLSEESRMRYKIFQNIAIMSRICEYSGCRESADSIFRPGLFRCLLFRIYSVFHKG